MKVTEGFQHSFKLPESLNFVIYEHSYRRPLVAVSPSDLLNSNHCASKAANMLIVSNDISETVRIVSTGKMK